MSNYTFTFKKDDIDVEFKTSDKGLMERQFGIWVCHSSVYAQKQGHFGPDAMQKLAQKSTPEVALEPTQEGFLEVAQDVVQEVFETAAQEAIQEEVKEIQVEAAFEEVRPDMNKTVDEEPSLPENEVFDKAAEFLQTINSIQEEPQIQQEPIELDFESVLEHKLENPTFTPSDNKDERFLKFIHAKNPQDKQNYLIFTAYYLNIFENCDRFVLKQINAKLMNNLGQIVEHEALIDAINGGFIEILPDLTGTAGASEYRLTEFGENSVLQRV